MIAKADLEERYRTENPHRGFPRRFLGYGLLMDRLADLRDEGKPLEEVTILR